MPLDFPANPTNGQEYGAYIYNATVGAWQAKEDPATVAVTSDVAPTSANNGEIWYNTTTGVSYVYYNDGNSGQWVEIVSSAVPALDSKADISGATFTGNISAPQITSTVSTGTSPLVISSTTAVTNLNADLLDGQHGSVYSPTGAIMQFAGASVPTGWLFCQGQELQIISYQTLYNILTANGTVFPYGTNTNGSGGAGTTHFRLPNLQNKVPVGLGTEAEFNALGGSGGTKSTSLTSNHIPQHNHAIDHDHASFNTASGGTHKHWISGAAYDDGNMSTSGSSNTQDYGLAADAGTYSSEDPNKAYGRYSSTNGSSHTHAINVPAFTGISGNYGAATVTPVSAIQPYIVLNYIIKT